MLGKVVERKVGNDSENRKRCRRQVVAAPMESRVDAAVAGGVSRYRSNVLLTTRLHLEFKLQCSVQPTKVHVTALRCFIGNQDCVQLGQFVV